MMMMMMMKNTVKLAYGAVHKVVCHAKCGGLFDPLPCHALSQILDPLKVCHKILTPLTPTAYMSTNHMQKSVI